jgi:V-type H+-transporting ATPase 16kDa proteolipid subunit
MGTWKSGISIVHTGIRHPGSIMKNVIPIVMAGVIGIYGLIVGVIIAQAIPSPSTQRDNIYSTYTGDYGIRAVGYRASQITLFPVNTNEAAGYSAIPDSGGAGGGSSSADDDIGGSDDQNKLFVGMLIMLIFSEALALYGMIVALIVSQHTHSCL